MVRSRRVEADAATSVIRCDGSADVITFFFLYEQPVMHDATDEEKASQQLCYPDGPFFNFFYDVFTKDSSLVEEADDYKAIKAAFIDNFKPEVQADDMIRRPIAGSLNYGDLLRSLRDMDRIFEKANFNDEAKFCLLRNAVMEHLDMAQFAVYCGVTNYADLKKAVKYFWSGHLGFQSSAVFSHLPGNANASMATAASGDLEIVPAKKLLLRPDDRVVNVEHKVDALADQLSACSADQETSNPATWRNLFPRPSLLFL